jgi:hypothetical protein
MSSAPLNPLFDSARQAASSNFSASVTGVIVVMDNLAAHKVFCIRVGLETA